MTEGGPSQAPRRPATARARTDEPEHVPAAPTADELLAIERQQVDLATQAGAVISDDPEAGVSWIRFPGRGPALNYAALPRWSTESAADKIALVEEQMRGQGQWPVLTIGEGVSTPQALPGLLEGWGWTRLAAERVMWTRHAPIVPHLDPGLRIEAVTAASALDFVRLEGTNFGLPPEMPGERAERLARAIDDGSVRGFLVRLLREPVAGARLSTGPAVAVLTAVGVTPRQRRRGYGHLVTAVATRAGLATGHKLVWLSVEENNVAALELYRGLGYLPSFRWSRWAAPAR